MIISHPSYDNVNVALRQVIKGLDGADFRPTMIIGLARGGLIPAVILSQSMGVQMIAVHYSSTHGKGDDKNHANLLPQIENERILIIDDICDSGHTMKEVVDHFSQTNKVMTAAIYHKDGSIHKPDFFWHDLPSDAPFIIFPWERNIRYLNL